MSKRGMHSDIPPPARRAPGWRLAASPRASPHVHGTYPLLALLFLALAALARSAPAQSPSHNPSHPAYKLHTNVREVLLDVTVTGSHGHPIPNLPPSAFHIRDNGRPQTIVSFTAHTASQLRPVAFRSNPPTYSNRFASRPPPVFNVLLIDLTTMKLVDQLYLYEQLNRLIHSLPANQTLAVYARTGPVTELYQNFTANHALLHRAVREILPRIPPYDRRRYSDYGTLSQMADALRRYPGRKNLLWFTGGSNFFAAAKPSHNWADFSLRDLYDTLESERICVYPIDVRGLTPPAFPGMPPSPMSLTTQADQQMLMDAEAEATGGHAYYNNNGLALHAEQVLANSSSFYTLTYSPNDLRLNHHWHRIRVTVTAPPGTHYHLSYRRGYFDDNALNARRRSQTHTLSAAPGITLRVSDNAGPPILFRARVTPVPQAVAHHGKTMYRIQYILPVAAFHPKYMDPKNTDKGVVHFHVGAAALAFDSDGQLSSRKSQAMTVAIVARAIRHRPRAVFGVQQKIALPTGPVDLYLAVWDNFSNRKGNLSGRLGTLQIPLDVKKR